MVYIKKGVFFFLKSWFKHEQWDFGEWNLEFKMTFFLANDLFSEELNLELTLTLSPTNDFSYLLTK